MEVTYRQWEAVEEGSLVESAIANTRLYKAAGDFKFPPTFDTPDSPGPYCANDYNENVRTRTRKQGPMEAPHYLHYVKK